MEQKYYLTGLRKITNLVVSPVKSILNAPVNMWDWFGEKGEQLERLYERKQSEKVLKEKILNLDQFSDLRPINFWRHDILRLGGSVEKYDVLFTNHMSSLGGRIMTIKLAMDNKLYAIDRTYCVKHTSGGNQK